MRGDAAALPSRSIVSEMLDEYVNYSSEEQLSSSSTHTHFLKRPSSRPLPVKSVLRMDESEAFDVFARLRWPETNGAPVCPRCGHEKCYFISTRKRFKCAACEKQFSLTSGTIFHSAKLQIRDYLAIISLFMNAAKGISALQISRYIGISYKAAFVILHKIREAISNYRCNLILSGEVEIDAAYFGGYRRPPNKGRRGKNISKKGRKKCVLVMTERTGSTVMKIISSEKTDEVLSAARKHISQQAIVFADEAKCYDALHALYDTYRINHSYTYSDGIACTNQAESYFARVRRAERGQYHVISGAYFNEYCAEQAFRTDRCRTDNATVLFETIEIMFSMKPSRIWKGYWRNRVTG